MDLVTQIKKNKPDFLKIFYSKKLLFSSISTEKKTHSDKYPVE